MPARRAGLGALAAVLAALGCVSGPPPLDHFYRLDPPTPERAAAPALPGRIEVDRFGSDDLLRGRAMLQRRRGEPEVAPYGYHYWVDSPTLLLQRALTDHLRAAGVADEVVTPEMATAEDWLASGHVRRFDHVIGGGDAVVVELELWVRDLAQRRIALRETYRVERPLEGPGAAGAARAFSAAVEEIFESFVRDLRSRAGARR